jgi:hypothetical protein
MVAEAYATVVYHTDGLSRQNALLYPCAAAMLGRSLTDVDSLRPKIAVVAGLSAEQEGILQSGGWRLRHVRPWWNVSHNAIRAAQAFRKRELWGLRHDHVLFIDADQLLATPRDNATALNAVRQRLQAIWSMPVAQDGVAALGVFEAKIAHLCFNGALLLLRPNRRVYERLQAIERGEAPTSSTCTRGYDQPVLNAVVGDRWSRIPEAAWRLLRPFREKPAALVDASRALAAGGAATGIDAFHFYFASQAASGQMGRPRFRTAAQKFTAAAWHEHASRLPSAAREKCERLMSHSER